MCFVFFAVFVFAVRSASAATCESIAALSLPNAKITAAQQVAPGAFTPPGPTGPRRASLREAAFVLPRDGDAHAVN